MIGKLRNHSGLKLDLNSRPTTPCSLDDDDPSSLRKSTSTTTDSWREDLVRIVSQNRSQSNLLVPSDQQQDNSDNTDVDLKPTDFENIQKLGEGAAGVVWKVRYKPTGLIMAKKVCTYMACH